MKKTKRFAAMAAAMLICFSTAAYLPQNTSENGVLTASASDVISSGTGIEIYGDAEAFIYHVNDNPLNTPYPFWELSAKVEDKDAEEGYSIFALDSGFFEFDLSGVDMTKAGTYPVEVIYTEDETIRTTFDIIVKEWQMEVYGDKEDFVYHVNDDPINTPFPFWELSASIFDEDGRDLIKGRGLDSGDFKFDLSNVDMTKAGTYPVEVIYTKDETIRTTFDIIVKEWQMEVYGDKENFIYHVNDDPINTPFPFWELSANIYDEDGRDLIKGRALDSGDFKFDLSNVDMTKAGTYPVEVIYTKDETIRTTFDIIVKEWQMEVYGDAEDFIYHVNDDPIGSLYPFWELSANIYDEDGIYLIQGRGLDSGDFKFDLSNVDMTKAGTYPVEVIYIKDETIRTTFDIIVKEWQMEVYGDEEDFIYHVNDNPIDSPYPFGELSASIYDEDGIYLIQGRALDCGDFKFDLSNVDMTKAGTYPVEVIYIKDETIRTTFNITVVSEGSTTTTSTTTTTTTTTTSTTTTTTTSTTTTTTTTSKSTSKPTSTSTTTTTTSKSTSKPTSTSTTTTTTTSSSSKSTSTSTTTTTTPVKVTLLGDANCDGLISLADAIAIYQALGNPDKYALSAQGRANADVSNPGNGVTLSDGLAIMMFQLGLIEKL